MPNRGEQVVSAIIEAGHRCLLNTRVTDVKRPLMSVSRMCDVGDSVTVTQGGGSIVHLSSGRERLGVQQRVARVSI